MYNQYTLICIGQYTTYSPEVIEICHKLYNNLIAGAHMKIFLGSCNFVFFCHYVFPKILLGSKRIKGPINIMKAMESFQVSPKNPRGPEKV